MNGEIGILDESEDHHPLFWIALLITVFMSIITTVYIDYMGTHTRMIGRYYRKIHPGTGLSQTFCTKWFEYIFGVTSSSTDIEGNSTEKNLTEPLLSYCTNKETDNRQNSDSGKKKLQHYHYEV